MEWLSQNEEDTSACARILADMLDPAAVVCLRGDLGMGKSVFARSLIRHLSGNPDLEIPSPTFTLVQTYETSETEVWHFDLYRLKQSEEIYELGWEEALGQSLCLIEWPERIEELLPPRRIEIQLKTMGGNQRQIIVQDMRSA